MKSEQGQFCKGALLKWNKKLKRATLKRGKLLNDDSEKVKLENGNSEKEPSENYISEKEKSEKGQF